MTSDICRLRRGSEAMREEEEIQEEEDESGDDDELFECQVCLLSFSLFTPFTIPSVHLLAAT